MSAPHILYCVDEPLKHFRALKVFDERASVKIRIFTFGAAIIIIFVIELYNYNREFQSTNLMIASIIKRIFVFTKDNGQCNKEKIKHLSDS